MSLQEKFSISAFLLSWFLQIFDLIMLRSHSSRILKEKYELIWKFSTKLQVMWRRLTLLDMFLDGNSRHSSSFISFLLLLSLFKPASPSFLPFQLILHSPSDEVRTQSEIHSSLLGFEVRSSGFCWQQQSSRSSWWLRLRALSAFCYHHSSLPLFPSPQFSACSHCSLTLTRFQTLH